jgi:hypothetical protein
VRWLLLVVALAACKKEQPKSDAVVLHSNDPPPLPPPSSSVVDIGNSEPPPPAKCASDADCVLVDITHCCSCCPGQTFTAIAKAGPTYKRDCSAVDCKQCGGPKDCASLPGLAGHRAVCRAGICKAELVKK